MLYALKSHEEEFPRISAEAAFGKLNGIPDWGESQRKQGWICPYCRQPVFLKGSHLRQGKGSASRVEAHFSHYSISESWLCLLFNSGASHKSSGELAQGIDHRQALSLFYSLPSTQDGTSWHNDTITSEAFAAVELLDSLGISSFEEDDRPFIWPLKWRHLPQSPHELIACLESEDIFHIGVRSFGLIKFEPIATGPLSVRGRSNAIRRFFLETGKERKEYFRRIASSGQIESHFSMASQIARSLIKDTTDRLIWHQGVTASLRLLALLLRDAVFVDQSHELSVDVCEYIYLLPLVRSHKLRIEIVAHKALVPKQRVVATKDEAKIPNDPSVCKMRKALWIREDALLSISTSPDWRGPRNKSSQQGAVRQQPSDDTYYVLPVANGLLVTSDSLAEVYKFLMSSESNAFLLSKDQRLAKLSWHRLQRLRLVDGGLRIDNRLLEILLCQESAGTQRQHWHGVEPGPKIFGIIDVGIIVQICERSYRGGR